MDDWKLEPVPPPSPSLEKKSDPRRLRWWFMRVLGVKDPADLARARVQVARIGKVWDEGCGTEAESKAGWFVVRSRCETVVELRERLGSFHEAVDLIEEAPHRSHARALVRQIPLIG